MKSYKDFVYRINDILLAVLIIAIACGIIFWRMNVIMDYPSTLAGQSQIEETQHVQDDQPDPSTVQEEPETPQVNENEGTTEDSIWDGNALANDVSVNIKAGSATGAAQCLIDAGLFTDYDEYSKVCTKAGVKPENIKAGSFKFNAGASKKDIVKAVTR